jgi:uncharacterized membrane protein YqjE
MKPTTSTSTSVGYLGSLRTLGDSFLAGAQERIELFTVELREEKLRLMQTFVWLGAAVFTGMMAITFASLTLVYFFWESSRLAVLGGLTVIYAGALVVIIIAFRGYLARQPRPFAATLHEIEEDRACIRNEN